jgi:hypothetical protein
LQAIEAGPGQFGDAHQLGGFFARDAQLGGGSLELLAEFGA